MGSVTKSIVWRHNRRIQPTALCSLRSLRVRLMRVPLGRRDGRHRGKGHFGIPLLAVAERSWWPFPLAGGGGGSSLGRNRGEGGARLGRGVSSGRCPRPVAGGWSFLESVGRERGARSGRGRCSLTWGGKEAGGCSGSGRCGKGALVGWLAVWKCASPFGERPSMQAGAGWVVDGGAGSGYGGSSGRRCIG